jgi:hypothetical protein
MRGVSMVWKKQGEEYIGSIEESIVWNEVIGTLRNYFLGTVWRGDLLPNDFKDCIAELSPVVTDIVGDLTTVNDK